MLIIPAIDFKEGACVRLKQGAMEHATIFSSNPLEMASQWVEQGAQRLHLVDLNAAVSGATVNQSAIKKVVQALSGKVEIQLGGGIRSLSAVETWLDMGISYVVLGTAAINDLDFLQTACERFPGKIYVGVDMLKQKLATHGWNNVSDKSLAQLMVCYEQYGVAALICTDISRDGMLSGVNMELMQNVLEMTSIPVIASGGVASVTDVMKLMPLEAKGLQGVVVGRALYEGDIDLASLMA